jgi:hypothetical protein
LCDFAVRGVPSSSPAVSIEDVPTTAVDILLVVIAWKLKRKVDEIPLSKTIKDLVGGKSTMQNEILGDQQGFASAPEKSLALILPRCQNANLSLPVSGTESDSDSIDIGTPTTVPHGFHFGTSPSLPPLSAIAERRSDSEEDTEDEAGEGGW